MEQEYEMLYESLKRLKPSVSLEEARQCLAENVAILKETCTATFFAIVSLYCKETGENVDDWFTCVANDGDYEILGCEGNNLPEKLVFILYKFVQKSVENADRNF